MTELLLLGFHVGFVFELGGSAGSPARSDSRSAIVSPPVLRSFRSQLSTNHSQPRHSRAMEGLTSVSLFIWLLNANPSGYPREHATAYRLSSEF